MKKKILLIGLLFSIAASLAHAHGDSIVFGEPLLKDNRWTAFQISLWPVKLFSNEAVYGLNLSPGLISYQEEICGLSLALGAAVAANFTGFNAHCSVQRSAAPSA